MSAPSKKCDIRIIRERLIYDRMNGLFTWRTGTKKGRRAGGLSHDGYWRIKLDGIDYQAHRLAWAIVTGHWPEGQLDHRDLHRSNNRFINLRPATHAQNKANRRALSNNRSGLKGVVIDRRTGKYKATIRRHHLGYFSTAQAAQAAYRKEATKLYGEFARAS